MQYGEWLERVDKDLLTGVWVVAVEEVYLFDQVRQSLQETVLGGHYLEFNYEELDARHLSRESLAEKLESLPLFAPRRVLLVNNAPFTKEDSKDPLLEALAQMVPKLGEQILLFLAFSGSKPFRGKFYKAMADYLQLLQLERLKEWQVASFIQKRLEKAGVSISKRALDYVVEASGYSERDSEKNLYHVANLADSLLGLADQGKLDLDQVEAGVALGGEKNLFALLDAIYVRDIRRAMALLQSYLASGEDPVRLFYTLATFLRNFLGAKVLQGRGMGSREAALRLSMNPYGYQKMLRGLDHYSFQELLAMQDALYAMDRKMKTQPFSMEKALETFLLGLAKG